MPFAAIDITAGGSTLTIVDINTIIVQQHFDPHETQQLESRLPNLLQALIDNKECTMDLHSKDSGYALNIELKAGLIAFSTWYKEHLIQSSIIPLDKFGSPLREAIEKFLN